MNVIATGPATAAASASATGRAAAGRPAMGPRPATSVGALLAEEELGHVLAHAGDLVEVEGHADAGGPGLVGQVAVDDEAVGKGRRPELGDDGRVRLGEVVPVGVDEAPPRRT